MAEYLLERFCLDALWACRNDDADHPPPGSMLQLFDLSSNTELKIDTDYIISQTKSYKSLILYDQKKEPLRITSDDIQLISRALKVTESSDQMMKDTAFYFSSRGGGLLQTKMPSVFHEMVIMLRVKTNVGTTAFFDSAVFTTSKSFASRVKGGFTENGICYIPREHPTVHFQEGCTKKDGLIVDHFDEHDVLHWKNPVSVYIPHTGLSSVSSLDHGNLIDAEEIILRVNVSSNRYKGERSYTLCLKNVTFDIKRNSCNFICFLDASIFGRMGLGENRNIVVDNCRFAPNEKRRKNRIRKRVEMDTSSLFEESNMTDLLRSTPASMKHLFLTYPGITRKQPLMLKEMDLLIGCDFGDIPIRDYAWFLTRILLAFKPLDFNTSTNKTGERMHISYWLKQQTGQCRHIAVLVALVFYCIGVPCTIGHTEKHMVTEANGVLFDVGRSV
jgi:hypothetical protein